MNPELTGCKSLGHIQHKFIYTAEDFVVSWVRILYVHDTYLYPQMENTKPCNFFLKFKPLISSKIPFLNSRFLLRKEDSFLRTTYYVKKSSFSFLLARDRQLTLATSFGKFVTFLMNSHSLPKSHPFQRFPSAKVP